MGPSLVATDHKLTIRSSAPFRDSFILAIRRASPRRFRRLRFLAGGRHFHWPCSPFFSGSLQNLNPLGPVANVAVLFSDT